MRRGLPRTQSVLVGSLVVVRGTARSVVLHWTKSVISDARVGHMAHQRPDLAHALDKTN